MFSSADGSATRTPAQFLEQLRGNLQSPGRVGYLKQAPQVLVQWPVQQHRDPGVRVLSSKDKHRRPTQSRIPQAAIGLLLLSLQKPIERGPHFFRNASRWAWLKLKQLRLRRFQQMVCVALRFWRQWLASCDWSPPALLPHSFAQGHSRTPRATVGFSC